MTRIVLATETMLTHTNDTVGAEEEVGNFGGKLRWRNGSSAVVLPCDTHQLVQKRRGEIMVSFARGISAGKKKGI